MTTPSQHGPETANREIIDMEEAIKRLKTTRPTFYRWLRSGRLKGMKVGRQWRFYADDIERFLQGEGPRVDTPTSLLPLLQTLNSLLERFARPAQEGPETAATAAEAILQLCLASKASSAHLEALYLPPQQEQGLDAVLRLRIEGRLESLARFDRRLLPALLTQFKQLGHCDPHQQEQIQEGQLQLSTPDKQRIDVRLTFLPTNLGETLSMRLLNTTLSAAVTLEQLALKESVDQALRAALKKGWGLVIASGPTGSGKTTTLYAALNQLASPSIKSFALEDPVEMTFPWVNSVPVNSQQGQGFAESMRAVLQADPDVLLVGELRDPESLELALRIGLTGHLLLTTLHSDSTISALLRLNDLTGNAYTVTEAVKLLLNQRLVRQLCECATQQPLTPEQQTALDQLLSAEGLDLASQKDFSQLKLAQGCEKCQQTGYRGRFLLTEALELTGEVPRWLHQGLPAEEIRSLLQAKGWRSWQHDGLMQLKAGKTSLEELLRVSGF